MRTMLNVIENEKPNKAYRVRFQCDDMQRKLSFLTVCYENMTEEDIQMLKNVRKRLDFVYRTVYKREFVESEKE